MKIEGIIFDLDGTLVHTIEDIAWAANRLFARHNLAEHPLDYYLKWIGNGAVKFIELAYGGPIEEELLMSYVREFKKIYAENLHNKSRIYPGIPELLDKLVERGIRLSVLSNKPHPMTQRVCEYYLSAWPFDPVLGQREEVPRKPDPAAAFEIAAHMGLEPQQILFVGDSDNDIWTAQAAGMVPLGVSWGYGRLMHRPVDGMGRLAGKPSEIIDLLNLDANK